MQASPQGAVVALADPEGSKGVWSGTQSGIFRISGRAGDLRPQAGQGATLDVRYRIDHAPERAVTLGLQCAEASCGARAGAMLDVTRVLKESRPGEWHRLSVPLSCFTAGGADLAAVVAPFVVETSGRFEWTIAEVRFAPDSKARGRPCP